MNNSVQQGFSCPLCQNNKFNVTNPENEAELDNLLGAKCLQCSHIITEDDLDDFRELLSEYVSALMNDEIH